MNHQDQIADDDRPVWGAAAIAEIIGRSKTQVDYLLRHGLLDASKCGAQWTTTKRRLLRPFQNSPQE